MNPVARLTVARLTRKAMCIVYLLPDKDSFWASIKKAQNGVFQNSRLPKNISNFAEPHPAVFFEKE